MEKKFSRVSFRTKTWFGVYNDNKLYNIPFTDNISLFVDGMFNMKEEFCTMKQLMKL